MTDNDVPVTPPASSSGKVFRFVQWIVFVLLILLALIAMIPLEYRGAPGFPETLFWISLACCVALALAHLPPLFFRLGRRTKILSYVAILPIFIFSMVVFGQAIDAFHQTPAGKIVKVKLDAEAEREALAEQRRKAIAEKKAQDDARREKLAERAERDDWLSRNPDSITPQNWSCTNLIPSIVQMSQSRPFRVLEITSPREEANVPGFRIMCNARAEWSNGATSIFYGAHVSDGGQIILNYSQTPQ